MWKWTQRNSQFYEQLCTEHQWNRATLIAFYTNFATEFFYMVFTRRSVLRQDPPWGYFSHLCSQCLNFFLFESSWKKWKMTPILCACAVVITLETQKCRKRAPRSVEFNFFNNCDRQKRFSQNERRRADLQTFASIFLIFALGLSYDLSNLSDDFTPFFSTLKDHNYISGQKLQNPRHHFVARSMLNKCAKFHGDSPSG